MPAVTEVENNLEFAWVQLEFQLSLVRNANADPRPPLPLSLLLLCPWHVALLLDCEVLGVRLSKFLHSAVSYSPVAASCSSHRWLVVRRIGVVVFRDQLNYQSLWLLLLLWLSLVFIVSLPVASILLLLLLALPLRWQGPK